MNRKDVQKPTNFSEYFLKNLSEKELQVMIIFEQRFLALNFEKLGCPFWTNQNQARRQSKVQIECTNVDFLTCRS